MCHISWSLNALGHFPAFDFHQRLRRWKLKRCSSSLRQMACQSWSAAAAHIQTAADRLWEGQTDGQAGRQASVLAAASTCRTASWEDRGREKGGFKLKVAAVAELRSCFFQKEVEGHQSLQVFFSLRFFSKPNLECARQRRQQRRCGDTSPPMGFSPRPFYFSFLLPLRNPSHYPRVPAGLR